MARDFNVLVIVQPIWNVVGPVEADRIHFLAGAAVRMTPRIQALSASVIGKIAAGEVVERPGSVAKELLENSLDAGATSVVIDVLEGGRDLLRVTDNGCGIAREDLPLAVAAHATSKIQSADDLFRVSTMGFRGEALASISGVSDFRLQSRPAGQETGAAIEVNQGEVGPVVECGCPLGTQIEVRHLFASVPVRRKFLKSKQTELGHISESMIRVALAHPGVSITLTHNERKLYQRSADMDLRGAIDLFFGSEIAKALVPVSTEADGIRVHGYVADPSVNRPTNRLQYLFVNGRFIRDRSLGHAVQEAYRGLLLTGRYPITFLFIDMPSDQVDVNVHPTKVEVRFEEPRRLYSQILSTIREKFLQADLAAKWQQKTREPAFSVADASTQRQSINAEFSLHASSASPATPSLWTPPASPTVPITERPSTAPNYAPASAYKPTYRESETTIARPRAPLVPRDLTNDSAPSEEAEPFALPTSFKEEADAPPIGPIERIRAIQLHNSYIVLETDEGMLLVDQHALHERILYEGLRQRVGEQGVESQELLVPEPVDLTPTQVGLLIEQASVLAELGFRIEEFGDRTILIRSYPAILRRILPADLIKDIACRLEETGKIPSRDQMLEELLHMVACKAAIKAGDPLTPEEVESLLRQRHLVEDSHHCPHGRPTVLRFTLGDLERQFLRK